MRPLTAPSGIFASRVSGAGWAIAAAVSSNTAAMTAKTAKPGRTSGLLAVGLEAARHRFPPDALHEGIDVLRRSGAVVHGIGVFVHVHRQDRPPVRQRH